MNELEKMIIYHRINDYLISHGAIPEDVEIPDCVDHESFKRVCHFYESFIDYKEKVLDRD